MRWEGSRQLTPITVAGREQWDLCDWAFVSISRALKEGDEWKTRDLRQFCQFLSTSHQFLLTFHPGLKQVSQTTHLNAQNDYNQISREPVSVREMAEDAEFGSGTSSTTRSAKNSLASGTWLRMLRLVVMVMVVMMKWSKDHPPKSRADLRGILPPYALEKVTIGHATK